MDFFGAFISGILSIVVYTVVFMGVYKLYYIAKDIHEIKELMERASRNAPGLAPPARGAVAAAIPVTKNVSDEDTASAYAENLLRAVSADSPSRASATQEVR